MCTQGGSEQFVVETKDESTTEILKELEEIEEPITTTLNGQDSVATTTIVPDFDVLVETTSKEVASQDFNVLVDNIETTTTTSEDLTIPDSKKLEIYAVKQMNFILDTILQTSYNFVSHVLQESDNSINQRDKLKRYAEILHRLLDDSNDDLEEYEPEDPYNLILKKITFLKGKGTKNLHKFLPEQWLPTYTNLKQELSIWLDKTSEQMHEVFNSYVSAEDDQVKFQYFNDSFDDIPRANEIHQKLTILADLVKIVTNRKQITFMDLYMQS